MEIKTQRFNKLHMPTIEKHLRNLEDAAAYLLGIASESVISGKGNGWSDVGMDGAKVVMTAKAFFEKLKQINTDQPERKEATCTSGSFARNIQR